MLDDGLRFLLANIECIRSTPLQLYSSLVVFAPQNSRVRAVFENEIPDWISLKTQTDGDWTPCLQTFGGNWTTYYGTLRGVTLAVFSHDSTLVASLENQKILVRRVNTSEVVQVWNARVGNESSSKVALLSFSHDRELLLTVSRAGTVRACRVSTGECAQTFETSQNFRPLSFSHDGKLLASRFRHRIDVWCVNMGKCIQTLRCGDGRWPERAFFSHDSLLLVTVNIETIQTWRIDRGECIHQANVHDLKNWDCVLRGRVTLSHDARLLACPGERGGKINIWCVKMWKLRRVLVDHMVDEKIIISSLAFSHDSARLASGSTDGSIRLWSVNTGECMRILNSYRDTVGWVAFSHDSTMILSINDAMLRIWHTNLSERVQVLEEHKGEVTDLILSPDSRLVVTKAERDSKILVWSTENGESHALRGHQGRISSAVFSRDSALLASASYDATRIWRVTTGECMHTLQGDAFSLGFSHDSKLLASSHRDKTIRIWHTDGGQCMHTLQVSQAENYFRSNKPLLFSNDSTLLVLSGLESVLSWWVDTGKLKDVFETGSRWPVIALSHDSQLVAISEEQSGNAIIIRLNTGKWVNTFPIGGESIDELIFSHDSRLLAAMSVLGTVRIWHIDTGECVQHLHVGGYTTMLSFGRDSRQLITNHGAFMLQGISPMRRGLLESVECSIRAQETPYSVGKDSSWVEVNGQKLLWLPVDYRPKCWVVSKSTIVLGCKSGKVVIIRFASDEDSESSGPSFQNKYTPGQRSRLLK